MGGYGVVTLNSSFHCSELTDPEVLVALRATVLVPYLEHWLVRHFGCRLVGAFFKCWYIVLLGQTSDPDVIFVAQNFWDHPGIRTIHAQDFKIKFSEPKSSWLNSPHPALDIWDPLTHLFAKVGPTAGDTWLG